MIAICSVCVQNVFFVWARLGFKDSDNTTLSTISLPKMSWPGIACRVVWYVDLSARFVLKLETFNWISQHLVCMLNNCIRLWISHQDHFSYDSIIIDTHITEILPNELATMVKGYKIRSWIMHEPFLLDNVSDCYWFLIIILFDLKPTSCQINHSDAFQRRNLNSLYVAFNIIWTNEQDQCIVCPMALLLHLFQAKVHSFWIVFF